MNYLSGFGGDATLLSIRDLLTLEIYMRRLSTLAVVGCLASALGCGSDTSATNSANDVNDTVNDGGDGHANHTANEANNAVNSGGDGDAAAQDLATRLYDAVLLAVQNNAGIHAATFANDGTEGLVECKGLLASPSTVYGQATLDFADGSSNVTMDVTLDMNGCLAMESGDNEPFRYTSEDLSGDDLADTFSLNGKLQAVTFDEDGFAPITDSFPAESMYDPAAEPTCSNLHFNNVKVEAVAFLPGQTEYSNETEPHNAEGYTSGTLTAECGGKSIRCDLEGGQSAIGALSLDSVASSIGMNSICVFE